MSKRELDHSIVGYFLTLASDADEAKFESFLLSQTPRNHVSTYALSRTLGVERSYLWTVRIGVHAAGSDRQGKPLALDGVVGVIADVRQAFGVTITEGFWSPSRTEKELIDEFNTLTGPLGKFVPSVPSGNA